MTREVLRAWVDATCGEWRPMNAAYFRSRGVVCSSDKWLYLCPWTPSTSLCLVVANDCELVTIIAFDPGQDQQLDEIAKARNEARTWEGQYNALVQKVKSGEEHGIAPGVPRPTQDKVIAAVRMVVVGTVDVRAVLALGAGAPVETSGGVAQAALQAYTAGEIDAADLPRLTAMERSEAPMFALAQARAARKARLAAHTAAEAS